MNEKELEKIANTFGVDLANQKNDKAATRCFEAAYQACEKGDWHTVKLVARLLDRLTNQWGRTLLVAAVDRLDTDVVRGLLEGDVARYQTDKHGNNPLHLAARNGSVEIVDMLLEAGYQIDGPNSNRQTPLYFAIKQDHDELVRYLAKKGASLTDLISVDSLELDAVSLAVYTGRKQCLDVLLKYNDISLDCAPKEGGKLLHWALWCERGDIFVDLVTTNNKVKELIESKDEEGRTPLSLAAYLGQTAAIIALREVDANLASEGPQGSAVHWAVMGKQMKSLEWLAHYGCKLNTEDNQGNRPKDLIDENQDPLLYGKLTNLIAETKISRPSPQTTYPENFVFTGGGMKGLAYIGALETLEKQKALTELRRVGGTSAGAITAMFIALGCDSQELNEALAKKNFLEFFDAPININTSKMEAIQKLLKTAWKAYSKPKEFVYKLLDIDGICEGEVLRLWLEEIVKNKTGIDHCTFGELKALTNKNKKFRHLHIVATKITEGLEITVFNSEDSEWDDVVISDAVRASGSFPGAFKPHVIHTKDKQGVRHARPDLGRYIDGGVLYNFPLELFDERRFKPAAPDKSARDAWSNPRTWGFYLYSPNDEFIIKEDKSIGTTNLAKALYYLYSQAETILRKRRKDPFDRVISIDNQGVGALEHSLTTERKQQLIDSGSKSTDLFLKDWKKGGLKILQEKIKRAQGRCNVDFPHRDFSYRLQESSLLKDALCRNPKQSSLKVIWAVGGMGKTELAKAFANSHLDDFSFIWWMDCETPEQLHQSYQSLAQALHIPITTITGEMKNHQELVTAVHNELAKNNDEKPWLLIFDNLENKPQQLPERGGSVLVTTRNEGAWDKQELLSLSEFTEEEACGLMEAVTGEERTSAMEKLVKDLDGLPLLVDFSANYIAKTPTCTVEKFQKTMSVLMEELGGLNDPIGRYDKSLFAAWKITLDTVSKELPQAAEWLYLCAHFSPDGIPNKWLDKWLSDSEPNPDKRQLLVWDIERVLADYKILRFKQSGNLCSIHRLWQETIKYSRDLHGQDDFKKAVLFACEQIDIDEDEEEIIGLTILEIDQVLNSLLALRSSSLLKTLDNQDQRALLEKIAFSSTYFFW